MSKVKKKIRKITKFKDWLLIEVCLLAAILVAAVLVCVDMGNLPAGAAQKPQLQTQQTQQATGAETTPSTPEASQPQATVPEATEPTWMELPEDRVLTAEKAFVYNCETEIMTFVKGAQDEKVYPASITKLMTAYVALRFLIPDEKITVGDVLDMVGEGSSRANLKKGDVLTVEQLIAALLLPSGNDAAYVLAEAAGREAEADYGLKGQAAIDIFMREMNGQAKLFGMSGTHFTNPDGYHEADHYTTINDMVKMVKGVMENEIIMKYAGTASMPIPTAGTVISGGEGNDETQWTNTNELINPNSVFYCPYATGLKTGQTPSAGSCLLSSFVVGEQVWIIGVFGCPTELSRFEDTLQLFNDALIGG